MIIEMTKRLSPDVIMIMGIVEADVMKIGDSVSIVSTSHNPIDCRIAGIEVYVPGQGQMFDMAEVEEVKKGKPAGLLLAGDGFDAIASGDRVELKL
jgi:hypothetical protein